MTEDRCPECGGPMKEKFEPDLGYFLECQNCGYSRDIDAEPVP